MKTTVRQRGDDERLHRAFTAIRAEVGIPQDFPPAVLAEAKELRERGPRPACSGPDRRDATDLLLRAIDPEGSRDLDQAYGAERRMPHGYRVHYAIADLGAFVLPGGHVDREARRRGVTQYGPDERASLHPEALNEDAASLTAGAVRPALLWTIDLDSAGAVVGHRLERATVRVHEAISYHTAQERIDTGTADESLQLLREVGLLRLGIEAARGAVSLALPAQEVVRLPTGGYQLAYGSPLPVERWNAQISLMTGMVAADAMLDAGMGVLRTLPEPDPTDIDQLRRSAQALGVSWPQAMSYPARARTLDPTEPRQAALLLRAARTLGGAGYAAFTTSAELPPDPAHAAIAAPYAHVTAPLRRVVDRFANEILLASHAGTAVAEWVLAALADLPRLMRDASGRARAYERAVVDLLETYVLEDRAGDTFRGMIVGRGRGQVTVQLVDPAIITAVAGDGLAVGHWVDVRLVSADEAARHLEWEVVGRG